MLALLAYHLSHLQVTPVPSHLHNLSQAAHSAAQGKIGSGFDVASAVYGSCIYRRFSPSILSELGEAGEVGFAGKLRGVVEAEWDVGVQRERVKVPAGLRLVMADVDCGSKTPGMVRGVLDWRARNPDAAGKLWGRLQDANDALADELVRLSTAADGATPTTSSTTSTIQTNKYTALTNLISRVRHLTRTMSQFSGVPIEPPSQTALLDACTALPGVIGGVIPGAGGFDAAVLVIEEGEDVLEGLERFCDGWRGLAGTGGDERVRVLGVREEMEGARVEDVADYSAWSAWEGKLEGGCVM